MSRDMVTWDYFSYESKFIYTHTLYTTHTLRREREREKRKERRGEEREDHRKERELEEFGKLKPKLKKPLLNLELW